MEYFHKKKLIFGTAENISYKTLEYALRKKLTIHTSFDYSSYIKLSKLYRKYNFKNDIILKFKCKNLNQFKKNLENYFKLFNTEKLYAVQISNNLVFSENFEEIYNHIKLLVKEEKILKIYLENYWEYSTNNLEILKKYKIDGLVLPFNIIEREISNKLLKYVIQNKIKIISLRIFSGNIYSKNSKTFINTTYIKYFSLKLFLKINSYLSFQKKIPDLQLEYFIKNKTVKEGIFSSSNIKNIEKNINFKDVNYNKFTYGFDNFFKYIIYFFSGLNSPSSLKHNVSLFYRIEIFFFRNIINLFNTLIKCIKLSYLFFINKNISYLASSSQFINLTELCYKKKISNCLILLGRRPKLRPLENIIKNYNPVKTKFSYFDASELNEKILIVIIFFFRLVKRFNIIVSGCHRNLELAKILLLKTNKNFENSYYLDDGTAALKKNLLYEPNNKINKFLLKYIDPSKIIYFTRYPKKLFLENNYENLTEIENKNKKVENKDKQLLILGFGFIEKKIVSKKTYIKILQTIKRNFSNYSLSFFPHPVEKKNIFLQDYCWINNIRYINDPRPVELYLSQIKELFPNKILSIYSSALVNLTKIYGDKIELLNIEIDYLYNSNIKDVDFNIYKKYFVNLKQIKNIKIL